MKPVSTDLNEIGNEPWDDVKEQPQAGRQTARAKAIKQEQPEDQD